MATYASICATFALPSTVYPDALGSDKRQLRFQLHRSAGREGISHERRRANPCPVDGYGDL